MRDILFRGKGNPKYNDGSWMYGYLCIDSDDDFQICGSCWKRTVLTETIGQYTGMKDKNDKKIFEGDIVVLDEDVKKVFNINDGEVKWGWGGFYVDRFGTLNSLNAIASIDCVLRGKVIGNIHDNPELLDAIDNDYGYDYRT